eukprot:355986-Chlamydomonas_euryale.AAC.23
MAQRQRPAASAAPALAAPLLRLFISALATAAKPPPLCSECLFMHSPRRPIRLQWPPLCSTVYCTVYFRHGP